MAAGLLGSFVGALGNVVGSKMTADANNKAARLNAIYQANMTAQANAQNEAQFQQTFRESQRQFQLTSNEAKRQYRDQLINDARDTAQAIRQANIDRAIQKGFAKHGVQWRADDARAAGIHPLAALGMNPISSTPIQVGSTSPSGSVAGGNIEPIGATYQAPGGAPFAGASGMGSALQNMGQDISRAIAAVQQEQERNSDVAKASAALSLENQALQNQLLATQIAKTRGASVGPSMPSVRGTNMMPGQGNTPAIKTPSLVKVEPMEKTPTAGDSPQSEPASNPSVGYLDMPGGRKMPAQSQQGQQVLEEDWIGNLMWNWNNRILPSFQLNLSPPPEWKGKRVRYNPFFQSYEKSPDWRWMAPKTQPSGAPYQYFRALGR